MRKELMIIGLLIFLVNIVSAETLLGTFERGTNINLIQGCDASNYSNITKIVYIKESLILLEGEITMTESQNNNYNYSFNDTNRIGIYQVYGHCDEDGTDETWWYDFEVTPSGQSGSSNIVLVIIIFIIVYGIALGGYFGRSEIVTLFGSMFMMMLGVYTISQGLIIYQDWLTNAIAYLSIGLGTYLSLTAGYSLYEDM